MTTIGERVKTAHGELTWRSVRLEDHWIDFAQLILQPGTWSAAYAVSYIESDTAQHGVSLRVGSDDQAKLYLNGNLIYKWPAGREFRADQDTVASVELKAGVNVLVFKVVNETGGWMGSVRFTDPDGNPLKGIRTTLTPP